MSGGTKRTKVIEHTDIVGQLISVGRHVAICRNNYMMIGVVIKLSPRILQVRPLTGIREHTYHIRPEQAVLLQEADMIVYLLKHSGD